MPIWPSTLEPDPRLPDAPLVHFTQRGHRVIDTRLLLFHPQPLTLRREDALNLLTDPLHVFEHDAAAPEQKTKGGHDARNDPKADLRSPTATENEPERDGHNSKNDERQQGDSASLTPPLQRSQNHTGPEDQYRPACAAHDSARALSALSSSAPLARRVAHNR